MALIDKINKDLIEAMKQKNQAALRGIRAIKSAILLLKSEEGGVELTDEAEIKLLQKLVKQRKEAIEIYQKQNRNDLAITENEELEVISGYLPSQLSKDELFLILEKLISETGAISSADFGKVMTLAIQQLAGKADGKTISESLKILLNPK
jgi:uncharacterized protein